MYELIYTSIESRPMTEDDLLFMLQQAREKNSHLGVTGLLFYYKEQFAQIIEGEKDAILSLYQTIRQDDRHKGVYTYWEDEIEERSFAGWSMGFASDNQVRLLDHEGYANFIEEGMASVDVTQHPNDGREFMIKLRDMMVDVG